MTHVNRLNIIYIAGTKGKGSTCTFIEYLLRIYGRTTSFLMKTGLYTSLYLINPEERIRINFRPLEKEIFTRYISETYKAL